MLIVAHRGFSAAYPGNTRPAFEKALEVGVDCVETDMRLSGDGVVVCHHDATLRGDGIPLAIGRSDLTVLRSANPDLVTLAELVEICGNRTRLVLDVKVPTGAMIDSLLREVSRLGIGDDCILGLRNSDQLDYLCAQKRKIPAIGLIPNNEAAALFIKKGAGAIRLWEHQLEADLLQTIRGAGCEVWVTGGRPGTHAGDIDGPRARRLRASGIDALMLNDPGVIEHD